MFGAEIKEKLLEFSIDGLTRVTYFLEICQSVNLRVTLRNKLCELLAAQVHARFLFNLFEKIILIFK